MAETGFLPLLTCITSGAGLNQWLGDDLGGALTGDEVDTNDNDYAGLGEASGITSDFLLCFAASSVASLVPAGATINGAQARFRYNKVDGSGTTLVVTNTAVYFVKALTVIGSSFGVTGVDWVITETASSFGSSGSISGGVSFTAAEAAASGTGVAMRLTFSSGITPATIRTHVVDQAEINWFYTELEEEADAGMERCRVQCC